MKTKIKVVQIILILSMLITHAIFPITCVIANDKNITITFNEKNMYDEIIEQIGDKVNSKDDSTFTITISQENIDSITELELRVDDRWEYSISECEPYRITDITGISNFKNLKRLDVGYNKIKDLKELKKLTNLEELDISSNLISNIESLSSLKKLKTLVAYGNNIENISALSNLSALEEVDLRSNNSLSNIKPLSGLVNLKILKFNGDNISNIEPLSNLINLEELDLSSNIIADISILSNLTNLEKLEVYRNSFEDISPISNLTNLKELSAGACKISKIDSLSNLINLEYLDIGDNQISDISPLSNLTNIKELRFTNNKISNIEALSNLKKLELLVMYTNEVVDLSPLAGLTNLKEIWAFDNNIEEIDCLADLVNLETLSVGSNKIYDISAVSNLRNLKELGLNNNEIEDISPIRELKNLQNISIGLNSIEDMSIIDKMGDMYYFDGASQRIRIVVPEGTKEVELPQIFIAAQDPNSKLCSKLDFFLRDCTISEDGKRLILDESVRNHVVSIEDGKLMGSSFSVDIGDPLGFNLDSVEITNFPTKTTYTEGEKFDKTGMIVTAKYKNGDTKVVKNYTYSPKDGLTKNDNEIVVTYKECGISRQAIVPITVKEVEGLYVNIENYKVTSRDNTTYIEGIQVNEIINTLKNNITTNGTIEIYNAKNQKITNDNEKIATGMKMIISKDKYKNEYILVTKGDVNGDSKADFSDMLSINKHRLGKKLLEGEFLKAGDVNGDNKVDFSDMLKINKFRLGKINSL